MNYKETKFAYRHKPTGKWVYLDNRFEEDEFRGGLSKTTLMYLIDEFMEDIVYNARNIIEEDLLASFYKDERYAAQNFLEFELVEIEIEYKIKQ